MGENYELTRRDALKSLSASLAGLVGLVSGCVSTIVEEEISIDSNLKMKIPWEDLNGDLKPKSISEIAQYLEGGISFSRQKPEIWKSAKRTVEDGMGNCKNTAVLGSYLAESLGYLPKILVFAGTKKQPGHAVSLLEKNRNGEICYGSIEPRLSVSVENLFPSPKGFNSLDNLAIFLRSYYLVNGRSKYLFEKWKAIDLADLEKEGCDWRCGSGNLSRYFFPHIKSD